MRTLLFAIAAAVASVLMLPAVLLLGFRFDEPPPAGPAQVELEAAVRAELDRQWRFSELEGIVERPDFVPAPIVTDREWNRLMLECMDRAGVAQWGYADGSGLFIEGALPTASDQLSFYWCFAAYPKVNLVSDRQRDFIYDYYASWLIPCLETSGFDVMNAPTRQAFIDQAPELGVWNPYRALDHYPRTRDSIDALTARCAPTIPGIAGWSEQ